jgi:transposase
MLNLPPSVRIWLATKPTDLRKSFDGLAELVRQQIQVDPFSGHLFVFRNKRADRVKLLYWDDDGYAIWYKRLEVGTFRFPISEFQMLLDGVDLDSVKRRRRYQRPTG